MAAIRRIYLVTIPGALLLIAGGAWVLSGQALKPIQHLHKKINQVTAQGLDHRVASRGVDQEFEGLIQSFNAMLARLERSFHQATRFSGDAAHELKTPLAILQGELEQAIQRAETGSAMQQTLNHLLEEVGRLSGIVRKLLLLSLADAGKMTLKRDPVNLSELLREQLEDVPLLAPKLQVNSTIEAPLMVKADRDLITQVIQNLLSNAIKYNQPQGWIRLQAHRQPQRVILTVANASRTLTVDERTHLFDRFYRGDAAHSRQTDGLGLGLSLSREIARAHGGDLFLDHSPDGQIQFSLWLPHDR
jgi:heavy metal sensor kinase